jgi:DNA-binding transcriptional ArsR family regulator
VKQLDQRALTHVAAYFKALSEPLRLRILNELRSGPRNVNDLTAQLACSQANVSKHLGVLARLGFVTRDAQGTAAFYRISDPAVYDLCDLVCGRIADQIRSHVETLKALDSASATAARPGGRKVRGTVRSASGQ